MSGKDHSTTDHQAPAKSETASSTAPETPSTSSGPHTASHQSPPQTPTAHDTNSSAPVRSAEMPTHLSHPPPPSPPAPPPPPPQSFSPNSPPPPTDSATRLPSVGWIPLLPREALLTDTPAALQSPPPLPKAPTP